MRTKRVRPKFWFYSYNNGSASATQLVEFLKGRLIKHNGSKYLQKPDDVVVNWGVGRANRLFRGILNNPRAVSVASSKLATFETLKANNVSCPEVTNDRSVAQRWSSEGLRVVGRDLDRASQGRGITVYEGKTEVGVHRFYVKYWRKQREFRVHIFKGKVIFSQEKLKKHTEHLGGTSPDKYIRSHLRGWCFAFTHLSDEPIPDSVLDQATKAVEALGLDFGAVDIAWNQKLGPAVLEVNTAPGLESSCLEAYIGAFNAN